MDASWADAAALTLPLFALVVALLAVAHVGLLALSSSTRHAIVAPAPLPAAVRRRPCKTFSGLPLCTDASLHVLSFLSPKDCAASALVCQSMRAIHARAVERLPLRALHAIMLQRRDLFFSLRDSWTELVSVHVLARHYASTRASRFEGLVRDVEIADKVPLALLAFDDFCAALDWIDAENVKRRRFLDGLFVHNGDGAVALSRAGLRMASEIFAFFDVANVGALGFEELRALNRGAGIDLSLATFEWVAQVFPVDAQGRLTLTGYLQLFLNNFACQPDELYTDVQRLNAFIVKARWARVCAQITV